AGGALLGYYPHVKQNPFQQMLYSASFEKGFACFDAHSPAEFTDIDTPIPMVAHYHWLFRVMRDAKNAKDAAHKAGVFLEHVHAQKRAGRTILWTVHNIISHGSKYPDEEASLRGEMAKLADHIHIMNADTVTLCMPYYDIPTEKCFYVPHPSYKGVYGDYVSKEDARQGFGLKREDKVFLLFGHMMPQKGGVRFLSQLDALQNALDGKSRILIAGQSGDADYMAQVMDLIGGRDDVQLHAGRVDD
ncbi:MAG: hypothetical protein JKY57_01085, partial [Kordiimonadaceae bacterium]|nr:hypothetical protein [Kordiimonadaceae bacterium]